MVHRKESLFQETKEEMRGGKGIVTLTHMEKEHLPKNGRIFAKLSIPPGCSIGEHEHIGECEMFYFLTGNGTVIDDGVRMPIASGDVMTTPHGHCHSIENTGAETMEVLAVIITD